MKRMLFAFAVMSSVLASAAVSADQQEKVLFGPVKYDVKERYGKENRYQDAFKAAGRPAAIELQNGVGVHERSELIDFTVNGSKVLREDRYNYRFLVCIVHLQKENSFELLLKDITPGGAKRPPVPPRFVTMTVKSYAGNLPKGVYGANSLQGFDEMAGLLQKIPDRESAALAASALNLGNDAQGRAEAMRRLSDRKDASALPLMLSIFADRAVNPSIRGEAAIGLGMQQDRNSIAALMSGVVDSNESVRLGSARALSLYSEENTREPLMKMLRELDSMRMEAVIQAVGDGGWKPVSTLLTLAQSDDVHVSGTAISLLGTTGDSRATDLLLKLLEEPGPKDINRVITALGETKDARAAEPLFRMAADPAQRTEKEAELGEALANLGHPKAVGLIEQMIRTTPYRTTAQKLIETYKRVTGKQYQ